MVNLPKLKDLEVGGKRVLVRGDLDISGEPNSDYRLQSLTKTLDFLKEHQAKIIICGHKGRSADAKAMAGKPTQNEKLSLLPLQSYFDKWGAVLLENLRFDPGEEANDENFAKELAEKADIFVNEAFATSHREHSSIVGIPKFLPSFAGFHFEKEIENLSRVIDNPQRPLLFIISGVKKDKLQIIEKVKNLADKVLVGGRLPEYIGDEGLESVRNQKGKMIIGNLVQDKEDITLHTIEKFKEEILKAKTIVLAGVLGRYEDEGHRQGTKEIFEAVANSKSFKVVGGGDSLAAIAALSLSNGFDWVSVGGGAMLEFLANGTLPGIEALKR